MMVMERGKGKLIRALSAFTTLQLVLILVTLSGGITLALLTMSQSLTNNFILADPAIEILEPSVEPGNAEWGIDSKNVKISSLPGNTDVYVRVALVISAKDGAGNLVPYDFGGMRAPSSGGELTAGDFTLHFDQAWEQHWFFKDGYFYYMEKLQPGGQTEVLLRGVALTVDTPAIRAKYRSLRVHVDVLASSIQTKGDAVLEWGVSLREDGSLAP